MSPKEYFKTNPNRLPVTAIAFNADSSIFAYARTYSFIILTHSWIRLAQGVPECYQRGACIYSSRESGRHQEAAAQSIVEVVCPDFPISP